METSDMELSEEHRMIRASAARFASDRVAPCAADLDANEAFFDDLYREMAQRGLLGIGIDQRYGGAGADPLAYALVMEELARGYSSVADQCGLVELVATLLELHGSPEQQKQYLVPLLRGERKCAFALTESEAGSDVASLKTRATRTAGGWRLNGSKIWIHNGPICDFAVVLARTADGKTGSSMSTFIVDRSLGGFSSGAKEHKMGQRASQLSTLFFDDVVLPAVALLGGEGVGFPNIMRCLDKGRVGIGALSVGICQAALDACIGQAKVRRQFGRAIGEFQAIQWKLADMAKDIYAARLMVHDAARKLGRGERATTECSMAKCFASDAAVAHTAQAVQVFGGSGFIRGMLVERLYRDAKITQIYEGTNEIQRLIIARGLLQ